MFSGGGLAVLYLALYAAFALYHLIPAPLAATGMLAVTTTGMTLSIRYSTYSLAAIALLGGFLTPIMLSTGQNQPLTLFGYILLLDIGTLLLLRFRQWPSLVAASLFGTATALRGLALGIFQRSAALACFWRRCGVFYLLQPLHPHVPPFFPTSGIESRSNRHFRLCSLFLSGIFLPTSLGTHLAGEDVHDSPGRN